MIKFIHKKRVVNDSEKGKITIYYSFTDIFLGIALCGLTVFFINDYLSHSLLKNRNNCFSNSQFVSDTQKIN